MSTLVVYDSLQTQQSWFAQNVVGNIFSHFGEEWDPIHAGIDYDLEHDKVLCLGAEAVQWVFQLEKAPKITKVRGRGMLTPEGQYSIASFSPNICLKGPDARDLYRDLQFDLCKICTNDAPQSPPDVEIVIVESRKDFYALNDLHSASFLACDIETTGFNPVTSTILSIGFGALTHEGQGYVVVVPQDLIGKEVLRFLKTYNGNFVFHNLKFDVQHLWYKFGRFEFQSVQDTMLMAYVLDERPFTRYKHLGLKDLSRVHFDAPDYELDMGAWLEEYFRDPPDEDQVQEYLENYCLDHAEKARTYWRAANPDAEWRGLKVGRDIKVEDVFPHIPLPKGLRPAPSVARKQEMWDRLLEYMAYDCYYTARLYPFLREEIAEESPRLANCLQGTLIPASLALANMEMTGAPVDVPYLHEMKSEIENILEEEMREIRKLVRKHTTREDPNAFNPNSPKQVSEVLYNAGDEGGLGLAMPRGMGRYAYKRSADSTTNSDTLKILARQCAKEMPAATKLINLILSYRVKSKIIGTYVDGLLERIDQDGRIRGDFIIPGTATGRLSCANPNLQNIPDASHVGFDIRRAYIPTQGWTLLEADYSQLELRVAALYSQDEVLIEAYRNGADIHQEVAQMLWRKPKDEVTKYERYLAKCMNFGVLYGRGAKSIATGPEMDNLIEMSGRKWSEKEIDEYFAKFKVGYGDLFRWMDLMQEQCFKQRYVEGPLGNRRRWPCVLKDDAAGVKRQIVNSPIQGFAAQITLHAVVELDRKFDPEFQRILFTVHDSILCECVEDPEVIRRTGELIKETMETCLPENAICPFPTLEHAPFAQGDPLIYNLPFEAEVVYGPNWGETKHEIEAIS